MNQKWIDKWNLAHKEAMEKETKFIDATEEECLALISAMAEGDRLEPELIKRVATLETNLASLENRLDSLDWLNETKGTE